MRRNQNLDPRVVRAKLLRSLLHAPVAGTARDPSLYSYSVEVVRKELQQVSKRSIMNDCGRITKRRGGKNGFPNQARFAWGYRTHLPKTRQSSRNSEDENHRTGQNRNRRTGVYLPLAVN